MFPRSEKNEQSSPKRTNPCQTSSNNFFPFYSAEHFKGTQKIIANIGVGVFANFASYPILSAADRALQNRLFPPSRYYYALPTGDVKLQEAPNLRLFLLRNHTQWLRTPLQEELIFRGVFLPLIYSGLNVPGGKLGIRDNYIKISAAVINSLIFSSLHPRSFRVRAFMVGLFFDGLTFFNKGSIVPSTSAHMANNLLFLRSRYKSL